MTEKEVIQVIEKTVSYLAPSFKFGYYDTEDMKQEGTIFCLEALPSFNFKKSNQEEISDALFSFLKTYVRWRFLNMRRKRLTRVEPPDCSCNLCKQDSGNRLDCKKYSNWVRRNMSKRSLMEPFDVNEVYNKNASSTKDLEELITSTDIYQILDEHIPVEIRADYRRFLEGVSIPKNKKEKLFSEIRLILQEHYSKDIQNEDRTT